MLDNVTVYWVTGTGASSARLYWESMAAFGSSGGQERSDSGSSTGGQERSDSGSGTGRVELPTGVASFPKEIGPTPRSWCEKNYHITHWTKMPRGGHFAAFEQPELFVEDVRAFFATVR